MPDAAERYLGVTREEIAPYLVDPWLEEWPEPRIRKAFIYYRHEARMRERHHGVLTDAQLGHYVSEFAYAMSLGLEHPDFTFVDERGERPDLPPEVGSVEDMALDMPEEEIET